MKTYNLLIIVIGLLFSSCAATNTTVVRHRLENGDNVYKIRMTLPSNYTNNYGHIVYSKNSDNTWFYVYSDSSEVYINNAITFTFPNYENIKRLNNDQSKLRLQNESFIISANEALEEKQLPLLPLAPYHFELSGQDENGLYWKDIKYGNISIGYLRVQENKKEMFDNALESFKVK